MRRPLAVATAVAAAVLPLLAGCSDSPPSDQQRRYALAVAAADPDDFGAIKTDELASTLDTEGEDLCDQLKVSFDDAAAYAKIGFSEKQACALIAAAVIVYCPDQRDKVPA